MGRQVSDSAVIRILLITVFPVLLTACGEFAGLAENDTADSGLIKFSLSLGDDELERLYDSITLSMYASCYYDWSDRWGDGEVRVRGFTSRMGPKKSFTLRDEESAQGSFKFALDAGGDPWISYALAMYAYSLAGFPYLEMEPVSLYMNSEYLGYYNILPLYDDSLDDFFGEKGELFKIRVFDMGAEVPAESFSEKEYPDNDDFSALNRYFVNARYMESGEWTAWAEAHVDLEDMAAYMAVRDYLGMADTYNTNFYIYAGDKYRILPWDNDHLYAYDEVGGDNLLTGRMLESEAFSDLYRETFNRLFLVDGSENIVDDMQTFADRLYNDLQLAVDVEPVFYLTREGFEEEKEYLDAFLLNRGTQILSDEGWRAFFEDGAEPPNDE